MQIKIRSLFVAVVLCLASVPAFALSVVQKVTPQWTKENGITVETKRRDDGTIGFTVTRYLDKARHYEDDSELTTRRLGHLKLEGAGGTVLSTIVAEDIKGNTAVYWFALAPTAIEETDFSLSEFPAYKDAKRESLIIGSTIYEFDLREFAAPLLPTTHP